MKYKDVDINHAHPDKLNVEIKSGDTFLTLDLSTSGYGSKISKEYYKKTYSHNTIVIGDKDQNLECECYVNSESVNMIDVTVKNAYENTIISRKIELNSNIIEDKIKVKNSDSKIVDYIFHFDAELIPE